MSVTRRRSKRCVFLDRDGTINRGVAYLRDPDRLRLLPGTAAAIARLNAAGFAVVVVTNQSGIARGLLDEATLEEIHRRLRARLARRGAHLDRIYHCPHHPDAGRPPLRRRCRCRKPGRGMIDRAVRELDLRLNGSFVVGDSACDIALAEGTPLTSILLCPAGRAAPPGVSADRIETTLARAADWILARDQGK